MARRNRSAVRALLLASIFSCSASFSQTYKSAQIVKGEEGSYESISGPAWLDYNLKEKYVELIFTDTVCRYNILKTGKPRNEKRFVIHFKGTRDSMLWNLEDQQNVFFAFVMAGEHYWFRKLSNCTRSDLDAARTAASNR